MICLVVNEYGDVSGVCGVAWFWLVVVNVDGL